MLISENEKYKYMAIFTNLPPPGQLSHILHLQARSSTRATIEWTGDWCTKQRESFRVGHYEAMFLFKSSANHFHSLKRSPVSSGHGNKRWLATPLPGGPQRIAARDSLGRSDNERTSGLSFRTQTWILKLSYVRRDDNGVETERTLNLSADRH